MRAAIISTYFGKDIGGAEVSAGLLIDGLKRAKHEVFVISANHFLQHYPRIKALLLNTSLLDNALTEYITKKLSMIKPDIVHIQDLMIAPAAIRAAKRLGLKTIVTIRDLRFVCNLPCYNPKITHNCPNYLRCLKREARMQFKFPQLAYLLYPLVKKRPKQLRKILNSADKLIAISHFVKRELNQAGIKTDTEVVHNPMPDWKYRRPKPHKGLILFAPGRLEKYKGIHLAIRALKLASEKRKDITLWIAGEGSYEVELRKLVKKLQLIEHVRFLGRLSQDEMKERYFDCDIVLFPSLWPEPLGRVPLEAMAAGKPIIANDVGGIKELVPCAIKKINSELIAEQILKTQKKLILSSGFQLENFITRILELYF